MFRKVLIAEDIDSINNGLDQALQQMGIAEVAHAKYCDDALLKIKKALLDQQPFDLLISDLSFEADHRQVQIGSGEALIAAVRSIQPEIKVIAYSVEERGFIIKNLFSQHQVNGFVLKGRKSLEQLKAALSDIQTKGIPYISPEMAHVLQDKSINEIDHYDVQLIRQLSLGVPQERMEARFKELGIAPNSKSTIEKRISRLKDYFRANNTVHLIAIAKDLGIT